MAKMSRREEIQNIDIPDLVIDPKTKRKYKKSKFLGRGGFAKCYELIDVETKNVYAVKVVAKFQLQKSDQKEKMGQEIAIHRSVYHKHIVGFHTFFEDKDYIYIILELCSKRSLMEMHKRRKTLSEPEVRYFVRQVALACKYLHDNNVVHRDLKLGNLFLNEKMEVKVGDFGLATKISTKGERKLTLCGTPNYIAPEVLSKIGHSFEVDIWSLGCIVYTLVVGKPPFETNDLKDTYKLIRKNKYLIPNHVPIEVKLFIEKMLKPDPKERPSMDDILNDPYLKNNYIPSKLPTSCLTMPPRFDDGRLSLMPTDIILQRKPLTESNKTATKEYDTKKQDPAPGKSTAVVRPVKNEVFSRDYNIKELAKQLHDVVKLNPKRRGLIKEDYAEDPASSPILWISKWVDYTDKYGIGYQLSDNSVGVLFNDLTRISMLADEHNLQYLERDGNEHFCSFEKFPENLLKKITLVKYFRNYMNEHLLKTGDKIVGKDDITRLPYLNNWFRTKNAIVFQLTNGIVQINYFVDHIKLILCPHVGAVTYVDSNREFHTFSFKLMERYGISDEVHSRLKYAKDVVERLMNHKPTTHTKK